MQNLEQNLTQYAAYHRDKRNIATHFVGVPMIVFAVVLALAVVEIPAGPIGVTLAAILSIAASAYYLRLDLGLGITMAITLFLMCAASSEITHRTGTAASLGIAAALGLGALDHSSSTSATSSKGSSAGPPANRGADSAAASCSRAAIMTPWKSMAAATAVRANADTARGSPV